MRPLRVLIVTGAYFPEISGGGLQCRELVLRLQDRVRFVVLTTAVDETLSAVDRVDGVPVYRIRVDVRRFASRCLAALRLVWRFARLQRQFEIVHAHSVSRKSTLVTLLAKLYRKRLILTLHTGGHDEPQTVRTRGRLAYWAYTRADLFVGVSPRLLEQYAASGLPQEKFHFVPNGVDLDRFRPAEPGERQRLRRALGLPVSEPLILFVGFFSREKGPHILFRAWKGLQRTRGIDATLLLIGATRPGLFEVDADLAQLLKEEARALGLSDRLRFVETTHRIEQYYRASDLFVLPSLREGFPVALLEAMASGLPSIASTLRGSTDVLITPGVNGWLVPPDDAFALEEAMAAALRDETAWLGFGRMARQTVAERYSSVQMAERYHAIYREQLGRVGTTLRRGWRDQPTRV
jgi:glycosyltransferase involved in cell wall biosynthesis